MLTLNQLEVIRQRAARVAAGDVGAAMAAYLAQTDVPAVLAEVERLRTVLVRHGIDPTRGAVRSGRSCRGCGCTDDDCAGCIRRTGKPCYWVEPDLCSACVPAEVRHGA